MRKLFIDDERFPVDDSYDIVRSSSAAIEYVKTHGMPNFISFDHDLGEDNSGEYDTSMVFINWMIRSYLDKDLAFPSDFGYTVHSQNPIGKMNIETKLDSFLTYIEILEGI